MPLYRYVKYKKQPQLRRSTIIALLFMGLGGGVLFWALWPILSFHLSTSTLLASVISPVSSGKANSFMATNDVVYAEQVPPAAKDYTNANVWFPLQPQKKVSPRVTAYTLSIPKLRIKDALVVIGGEDLSHSIIHYGGTALPGENGNAALFGHSVLPQFFDQKNYKTIFSTLPNLILGDEILITYDGIIYRYLVENLSVTNPDDLTMLEQQYDNSYITLVTCVPPGTYWQRLHVRARLIRI